MSDIDPNSTSGIEIIYTDNKNMPVEEKQALYKTTNYYDSNGKIIKFKIEIRFSLDQEW